MQPNKKGPHEAIRVAAQRFVRRHNLSQVVADHQERKRNIQRPDYYEFIDPAGRGLTDAHLRIIADDIAADLPAARLSYLSRGGKIRSQRRTSPARPRSQRSRL